MSKIKLIIEIEKRTYELLKEKPDNIAESIIANGTPYNPTGGLTEAEKIICKVYLEDLDKMHTCNEYKLLMNLIDNAPTIVEADKENKKKSDELPSCNNCVHNGEWSSTGNCIKCSCFDRYEKRGNQ